MTRSFRDVLSGVSALDRALLDRARKDATWEALNQQVPVTDLLPPAASASASVRWPRDGWAAVDDAAPAPLVGAALAALALVRGDGWPAVFVWMLDAPWRVLQRAVAGAAVTSVLGEKLHILPRVWAHGVTATAQQGWPPHQDERTLGRLPGGAPVRLTAWLALTHATLDNGCVHLIPNHVAPDVTGRFAVAPSFTADDVAHLLHHVRALPAAPGTLLLWEPTVVHWGGQRTRVDAPERWALSAELMHQDATPASMDVPLLDLVTLPSLAQRRAVVAQSLTVFAAPEREPHAAALHALASRLV